MRYGIKLICTIADMSNPDTLRQMHLISPYNITIESESQE